MRVARGGLRAAPLRFAGEGGEGDAPGERASEWFVLPKRARGNGLRFYRLLCQGSYFFSGTGMRDSAAL